MLRRIICLLSGERMLFNTTLPYRYKTGKVIDASLGGGNKAFFRVSRTLKTKPVQTYNNGQKPCYEVWGKEEV